MKNDFQPKTAEEKSFKAVLDSIDQSRSRYEVFCDWLLVCALAYAQVSHFEQRREDRYRGLISKYKEKDRGRFAELLAITATAFTDKDGTPRFQDFLGNVYMCCGFGSSQQGQFFTPYCLCQMTAKLQGVREKDRIMKVNDPAVGGGALLIAYAEQLWENGINYQQYMLGCGTDISINSCCMCMIQCSLLGIPAIITHGDTLSLKVYEQWETPMVGIHLVRERLERQESVGTVGQV